MISHLSAQDLISYIHHTHPDIQREELERHLADCPRCRDQLAGHQALQQHIQHDLQTELGAAHPSSRMTFAAIAPRLRPTPAREQPCPFFSGAAALVTFGALAIILVALFGGIHRPSGGDNSAALSQPPTLGMGAVYTASLVAPGNGQVTPTSAALRSLQGTVTPSHTTQTLIGDQVNLLGYDLSEERVAPGTIFTVTLYWQAQRKLMSDYTVFLHLLDSAGRLVASHDSLPASGTRPTTIWHVGETITDSHVIVLPGGLTAGNYRLSVGLYDSGTGVWLGEPVPLGQPITIVP